MVFVLFAFLFFSFSFSFVHFAKSMKIDYLCEMENTHVFKSLSVCAFVYIGEFRNKCVAYWGRKLIVFSKQTLHKRM